MVLLRSEQEAVPISRSRRTAAFLPILGAVAVFDCEWPLCMRWTADGRRPWPPNLRVVEDDDAVQGVGPAQPLIVQYSLTSYRSVS